MPEEPLATLLASWRLATERYLSSWNTAFDSLSSFAAAQNQSRSRMAPNRAFAGANGGPAAENWPGDSFEGRDECDDLERFDGLDEEEARAKAAREILEPLIEFAGGIPLADFEALTAQVDRIHTRLDEIESGLKSAKTTKSKPKSKSKKGKKKRS